MPDRQIHPARRVFSASNVRDTIAKTLETIKDEDGLTYSDMGRVMGKSGDRAEAYCKGDFSDMSGFSLLAAWREWNGRFIGPLRDLVENSRPGHACDRTALTALIAAAGALSKALEDGVITPEEVRGSRAELERARDAISDQLAKLRPAA